MTNPSQPVWAWAVGDLIRQDEGDSWDRADRWDQWSRRHYVTDIFNAGQRPPPSSVLVGVTTDGGVRIVALGYLATPSGGVSTGRLRGRVDPLLHMKPVDIGDVAEDLVELQDLTELLAAEPLRPRALPVEQSRRLLDALTRLVPDVGPWLSALEPPAIDISADERERLDEERDALRTGLDVADVNPPGDQSYLRAIAGSVSVATDFLNPDLFADNEDDLIFADIRRFSDVGILSEVSASTSVYRDGTFVLAIANVNRKPIEHHLGVDLLYWDQTADSFTLVQYKRLNRAISAEPGRSTWAYTKRYDLVQQLAKMETVTVGPPAGAGDWRMVPSPFWFKFVRTDAFVSGSREVLKGMYVPADYLGVGLETNGFQGPNGGFRIDYDNTRYINRGPFVHLVQRHMTGSTEAGSAQIHALLSSIDPQRELMVVKKSSVQQLSAPSD